MIRDQCRAYCQCSHCKSDPSLNQRTLANDGINSSLRITKATMNASGLSKDELYMKSLSESLRARSLMASSKNAAKFVPDEQLLSIRKQREAKEAAIASQQVPLRRRDRLQELLLLEQKARLQEEARLRKERLSLGLLPYESVDKAMSTEDAGDSAEYVLEEQRRLNDRSTPSSCCSAEHDLHATLHQIKGIVEESPSGVTGQPLNQEQLFKLRQIVREQDKKSRTQLETCQHRSHLCNHCLDVNVQARHLCPELPTGSVAFEQTGKIINPEEGVRYGTDSKRGPDGTYSSAHVNTQFLSNKVHIPDYNPHPQGSGVVLMPLASVLHKSGSEKKPPKCVKFEPIFNNNIGSDEVAPAELQYPGSTYHVYDKRDVANKSAAPAGVADEKKDLIDLTASGKGGSRGAAGGSVNLALASVPAMADSIKAPQSSSAMWRTTNQNREEDLKRFLKFQEMMRANSRKVYDSTTTRDAAAPAL